MVPIRMIRTASCVAVALLVAAVAVHANPAEYDYAMVKLATASGCMDCHTIVPAARRADGLPPIAPAWRDVALKYRNDPIAHERLTRTVLSGSDRNARHWAGKVGASAMPPNAGDVSEADAHRLVDWVLVLVP